MQNYIKQNFYQNQENININIIDNGKWDESYEWGEDFENTNTDIEEKGKIQDSITI